MKTAVERRISASHRPMIRRLGKPVARVAIRLLLAGFVLTVAAAAALAQSPNPCPRSTAGSTVQRPPDLLSRNGILNVTLNYFTSVDDAGRTLFCFVTPGGLM